MDDATTITPPTTGTTGTTMHPPLLDLQSTTFAADARAALNLSSMFFLCNHGLVDLYAAALSEAAVAGCSVGKLIGVGVVRVRV
jgi:hypothetical protein